MRRRAFLSSISALFAIALMMGAAGTTNARTQLLSNAAIIMSRL